MNWWLIGLSVAVLTVLILQLSIMFFVLPAIKLVLVHLVNRVGSIITSVQRIKMVIKYEEGVDVDQEQPFEKQEEIPTSPAE